MGFGNISIWQLLILLLIVVLVFGTKKLRGMGGDLGSAIRDFRKGMSDNDNDESASGEKSVSVEESDDTASATKNTSDSSETRT